MSGFPLVVRDLEVGRFSDAVRRVVKSKSIVLDVDFDFFCRSEHISFGNPGDKKIDQVMFADFFDLQNVVHFQPVVGHDESLQVWLSQKVQAATCIHFDYHHDCYISSDRLNACSLSRLDEIISIGNYLPFARKCGVISHVIWVAPNEVIDTEADEYVRTWIDAGFLSVISWSEYLEIHEIASTKIAASGHTVALSPDFVSSRDLVYFFEHFNCDDEFKYRALDYGYFSVLANRAELRWRWHALNLSNCSQKFFHGSPLKGLSHLEKNHSFNFVSPSMRFASCFESDLIRGGSLSLGVELFNEDPDTIIVSGKSFLLDIFKRTVGSTYEVTLEVTPENFSHGCSSFEFTIDDVVDNLVEGTGRLEQAIANDPGLLVVYPHERMTLSNVSCCQEFENFIAWMEVDDITIQAYPSSVFYYNIFNELQGEQVGKFFPLITWYRFGSRELFAGLRFLGITSEANGYHGLQHCLDVGLMGVLLAHLNDVPATPIFIAALAHDLRREGPKDHHNAPDSALLCQELLEGSWSEYASNFDKEIIEAVAGHSSAQPPLSTTAAILRDADRIRLSWERGFDERFFHTKWGKEFAQRDSSFAQNVFTRVSFAYGSILEFNLTENIAYLVVLNRKFQCSKEILTDTGMRARVINHYKVKRIIVYGDGHYDRFTELDSPFLSEGVFGVSWGRFGAGVLVLSSGRNECDALKDKDISHLVENFEAEDVQIRVTPETFEEVIESIDVINNKQISLVVPGTSIEVKTLIGHLIIALKDSIDKSDEAIGAKIICEVAWCHFSEPEEVLTYFEKIGRQYSPIIPLSIMGGLEDIVRAIVIREIEEHSECGDCAFSLHCPRRDLDGGEWKLGRPFYKSHFKGWNPYVVF